MQIRAYTSADFAAADALWRRTDGVGPVPRDELERLVSVAPELVLVATVDREVIGAVIGTDDGRRGWIFRLAVDAAHRGRGVGAALVREVEDRLAARGVEHVRLLVLSENQVGMAFWPGQGYEGFDRVVLFGKQLGGGAPDGPADGSAATAGDPGAC